MKTIVTIAVSIFFGVLTSWGQTETIVSSKTEVKENVVDKDYSRVYAFLDFDDSFRIRIKFMDYLIKDVKNYMISEFGEVDAIDKSGSYIWEKGLGENYIYEARLKGNRLRIKFNKEKASKKDVKRIEEIAEKLKVITARK